MVAQQTKYYISVGTNMVDDSFFTSYNPFEFEEQWHFGKTISAFKFGVDMDNRWIIEAGFSSNNYSIGKRVNGQIITSPKEYKSYDLQLKHYWSDEIYEAAFFEKMHPFVALGVGNIVLDQTNRFHVNYGLGAMIWLFDWDDCSCRYIKNHDKLQRLGLLLQANGKSALNQKEYGNLLEYQVMVVYKF